MAAVALAVLAAAGSSLTVGHAVAAPSVAAPSAAAAVGEAEPPLTCPSAACRRISTQLGRPGATALDSTGQNLYFIDGSMQSDSLYRFNMRTGEREWDPIATGVGDSIALADDHTAYTTRSWSGELWRVDLDTGRKTEIVTLDKPYDIALDGKGKAYVTTQGNSKALYEVDLATKQVSEVYVSSHGLSAVALDGKGNAYVTELGSNTLYRVSLETGRKTEITEGVSHHKLSLDRAGRIYYMAGVDGGSLYRVDPAAPAPAPEQVATGLGTFAYTVTFDDTGAALVTEWMTGTLWRITHLQTPGSQSHSATVVSANDGQVTPGGFPSSAVRVTNTGKDTIGNTSTGTPTLGDPAYATGDSQHTVTTNTP
ncbi:Vgb family protein [Streptomyces sp. NPDC003016]